MMSQYPKLEYDIIWQLLGTFGARATFIRKELATRARATGLLTSDYSHLIIQHVQHTCSVILRERSGTVTLKVKLQQHLRKTKRHVRKIFSLNGWKKKSQNPPLSFYTVLLPSLQWNCNHSLHISVPVCLFYLIHFIVLFYFCFYLCFLYPVQHFANTALKQCYINENVLTSVIL